jgi:hypothetical protein
VSTTTFRDRALACIQRGFQVIPLRPESKIPPSTLSDWPNLATNSLETIDQWNQQNPAFNCGVVFKAVLGTPWALETDSPKLAKRYEEETGRKLPKTLTVQSRVGRGHRFYLHTAASLAMGNIGQANADGFSVRCDNQYCVSMLSVHPETKSLYKVVVDTPMVPAPDDFVEWLAKQREPKTQSSEQSTSWMDNPILEGARDNTLTKIAGKLRNAGLDAEALYAVLSIKNQTQCIARDGVTPNPLDDADIRRIANSVARYEVGAAPRAVMLGGIDISDPASSPTRESAPAVDVSNWGNYFKSVGELESGDVRMLISGFLPEGTSFIGALPGVGKTLIGLSIVKALTTGKRFLGHFDVPDVVPVVYLIPESSGRAFRSRCEKFGIPSDRELFLCRTISEGTTLLLDDPILKEAVRVMKPVVILDTAIRFSQSSDENSASQNKRLGDDIVALRQAGAIAVIAMHHSTKASRNEELTLENTLRGTGDLAALADAVYGLRRDDLKYDNNRGANEINVICVKPRDFDPPAPFRIAATYMKSGSLFPVSYIDETGDFKMLDVAETLEDQEESLLKLIQEYPSITLKELEEHTGIKTWKIQKSLQSLGWVRPRGNPAGGSRWVRSVATIQPKAAAPVSAEASHVPAAPLFDSAA